MTKSKLEIIELTESESDIQALHRFYDEIYCNEFPCEDERESLQNMESYLRLKATGWYKNNNYHIVLIVQDGKPIAGSIFNYLAEACAGVIEFLFVSQSHQGFGIGKRLLEFSEMTLIVDADKNQNGGIDIL